MALMKCPECEREVSDFAVTCPNCGYGIKDHLTRLENTRIKEERDRQVKEENERKEREAAYKLEARNKKLNNLKTELSILRYNFFGTRARKIVTISTSCLLILLVVGGVYLFLSATEEWRTIKRISQYCVDDINKIENELFEYTEIKQGGALSSTKLYFYNYTSFSGAGIDIGNLRELRNRLDETGKSKLNNYLNSKYGMSWNDLDNTFKKYGLDAQTGREAYDKGYDFYKEKLMELRDADQPSPGKVYVVEIEHDYSGDSYCVSGVVKNTTQKTVYFVKVKISLIDSEGNVINTDNTYAVGDEGLEPGESSTFDCYIKRVDGTSEIRASVYDYDI